VLFDLYDAVVLPIWRNKDACMLVCMYKTYDDNNKNDNYYYHSQTVYFEWYITLYTTVASIRELIRDVTLLQCIAYLTVADPEIMKKRGEGGGRQCVSTLVTHKKRLAKVNSSLPFECATDTSNMATETMVWMEYATVTPCIRSTSYLISSAFIAIHSSSKSPCDAWRFIIIICSTVTIHHSITLSMQPTHLVQRISSFPSANPSPTQGVTFTSFCLK